MTAFEALAAPTTARIDPDGVLLAADARLLELIRRAGGDVGRAVAVPELAALARLARRLGIAIARDVTVADGGDDVDLWLRAEPSAEGVLIEVTGWRSRPALRGDDSARGEEDFLATGGEWGWETDATLRFTHLSTGAGTRHGFDAAALLGRPLVQLFALAEDGEGGFPILGAVAAQMRFDGQLAEVRGTGQRVRLSAMPRIDDRGRFAGLIGSARPIDMPPERAAKTPLADPALPAAFGRQLDRALRPPLERIIANANSMSAEIDGPLAAGYSGYAADIATAGRHLLGLVGDLVDLETVEQDDFAVADEPIDLADVARRASGLLAVRAAERSVRIDRPGADDALPASGDFRRALQILVNLIANAVRYSPEGGMVWVRCEREDQRVCVIVADQGRGIAAADHERIFGKFERVDPGEPGGSGLGLYISRRLARAMGGDITVDSAPGQGARFILTLPARSA